MIRNIEFKFPYYAICIPEISDLVNSIVEDDENGDVDYVKGSGINGVLSLSVSDAGNTFDSSLENVLVKYNVPYDLFNTDNEDMYEATSKTLIRFENGSMRIDKIKNAGFVSSSELKKWSDFLEQAITENNMDNIQTASQEIAVLRRNADSGYYASIEEEIEKGLAGMKSSGYQSVTESGIKIFEKIDESCATRVRGEWIAKDSEAFAKDILTMYQESDADIDEVLPNGMSMLHIAAISGSIPLFDVIARHCNPDLFNLADTSGRFPVDYLLCHKELFQHYIDEGYPLDSLDNDGNNILMRTMNLQIPVEIRQSDGDTGYLTSDECLDIARQIIENNVVDINAKNNIGITFLHGLVGKHAKGINLGKNVSIDKKRELIELAVKSGADINASVAMPDGKLITPLDVASDEETRSLLLYLLTETNENDNANNANLNMNAKVPRI